MHYDGADRDFILRFVDSGTKQRAIERLMEFKKAGGGSKFKWVQNASEYGNRGSIAARGFFKPGANRALQNAVGYLTDLIDEEIEKIFNVSTSR